MFAEGIGLFAEYFSVQRTIVVSLHRKIQKLQRYERVDSTIPAHYP